MAVVASVLPALLRRGLRDCCFGLPLSFRVYHVARASEKETERDTLTSALAKRNSELAFHGMCLEGCWAETLCLCLRLLLCLLTSLTIRKAYCGG